MDPTSTINHHPPRRDIIDAEFEPWLKHSQRIQIITGLRLGISKLRGGALRVEVTGR